MLNRLYDSPDLLIHDYLCRHRTAAAGREEFSSRHEIAFPRTGLYVKHLGRERVLADPNQILFFNRGEAYRVSHPLEGGDRSTTIWVNDNDLRDLLSALDPEAPGHREEGAGRSVGAIGRPEKATGRTEEGASGLDRPFASTHVPCSPHAAILHRRLLILLTGKGHDGVAIQETVFHLLEAAIAESLPQEIPAARPLRHATRRDHRALAFAAQTMLNERFHAPLTLRAIATTIGSSPYHLSRIFHRETGLPVHRYLNRLRLRASLERLADGEGDLTDLALSVGFSDHSHFTNAFRGEFGIPPSRFRALATTTRIRQMSKNLQA